MQIDLQEPMDIYGSGWKAFKIYKRRKCLLLNWMLPNEAAL
jgi:hypothetical protein